MTSSLALRQKTLSEHPSASNRPSAAAISRQHEEITQKDQRKESPGFQRHSWSCPERRAHKFLHGHLQHLAEPSTQPSLTWKPKTHMSECSAMNTIIPQQHIPKLTTWILHLPVHLAAGLSEWETTGSNTSSPSHWTQGPPQGCVLSPLIFLLLTPSFTSTPSYNVFIKFADDTSVVGR